MDVEKAKYLVTYFTELLSSREQLLIRHAKSHLSLSPKTLGEFLKEIKRVDKNAETAKYFTLDQTPLRITNDNFDVLVATKILEKHKDKVFFNYCTKCGRLARTPLAKQCRCGHDWHNKDNSVDHASS